MKSCDKVSVICSKESEINDIHKNIRIVNDKLSSLEKKIIENNVNTSWIKKALEGNGEKGLVERVMDNEKKIWMAAGGLAVISILATILGLFAIVA